MDEEQRQVGHREGVTVSVEHKLRTVYWDGTVVDSEPQWVADRPLAEYGGARIRRRVGDVSSIVRTRMQSRGVVDEQSFHREVRTEVGPWLDLTDDAVREQTIPTTYVAQVPIMAGQLLYTRAAAEGEQVIVSIGGAPSSPVWPLTPEAAPEGFLPFAMSNRPAQPGEIVDFARLGEGRMAYVSPTVGEQDAPKTTEMKSLSEDASLAFAERRHMGQLLTWDDLAALQRAGEMVLAGVVTTTDPDRRADLDLIRALRQALGKLDLGRTHGYEAAES
jgi:hypothetical protein